MLELTPAFCLELTPAFRGLPGLPRKFDTVFVPEENILPPVSPRRNVVQGTGIFQSQWSCHATSIDGYVGMLELTPAFRTPAFRDPGLPRGFLSSSQPWHLPFAQRVENYAAIRDFENKRG